MIRYGNDINIIDQIQDILNCSQSNYFNVTASGLPDNFCVLLGECLKHNFVPSHEWELRVIIVLWGWWLVAEEMLLRWVACFNKCSSKETEKWHLARVVIWYLGSGCYCSKWMSMLILRRKNIQNLRLRYKFLVVTYQKRIGNSENQCLGCVGATVLAWKCDVTGSAFTLCPYTVWTSIFTERLLKIG